MLSGGKMNDNCTHVSYHKLLSHYVKCRSAIVRYYFYIPIIEILEENKLTFKVGRIYTNCLNHIVTVA